MVNNNGDYQYVMLLIVDVFVDNPVTGYAINGIMGRTFNNN